MATLRNLLTRGNKKLGESIHAWSIPAILTCPGRTALCESICYARQGHYHLQFVQDYLKENLDLSLQADFERRMIAEIKRRGAHTVRIHVSGDFYDPDYARKWLRIAERSTRTMFFCYTRSWRLPEFTQVMQDLASLKNWRLWYSVDAETDIPIQVPEGVELAYLMREVTDDPDGAKLVFRVQHLRRTPAKRIGLALVCSTETGLPSANDVTCTTCRRCFK